MYMTSPKRKNGSTVVRLVVSFRQDGKVKNRIVKVIGQSKDPRIIEHYKKTARKLLDKHKKGLLKLVPFSEKLPIDLFRFLGEDRYNQGFEDILGTSYEKLGFKTLIKSGKNNKVLNEVLRSLILMRVFSPASKLRSCCLLEKHFNKVLSHKRVLGMMDHLSKREEEIKGEIFRSVLKGKEKLEMLLFDVTTLSFESVSRSDLKDFGYSKDGKFNEVQVILAVLANEEGMPVSYELFPGNTSEFKTLEEVLNKAIRRYEVKRVRVMADRGLFSEANLRFFESLRERGLKADYVLSCPLKKLPVKEKEKILDPTNYHSVKRGEPGSYYEFRYKGRRIVVGYSEERGRQDQRKREKILEKLRDLGKEGEISTSRLIKNQGIGKYVEKVKGKTKISWKKVEEQALWDGLYGVCTSLENQSAQKLFNSYSSLWKIEELFRINKHTLKMRPIYHRLTKRIRAHILICFLSYTVLRHTELRLKKAGLNFSLQELIDILKSVEIFIIRDKIKKPALSYCVPRALSKEAKKIYAVFKKDYPQRPYLLS